MRVGIAQIDTRIGDFAGNARRIVRAAAIASDGGAELVVFPELCVTGYPPRDLLLDPAFVAAAEHAVQDIARGAASLSPLVVGSVVPSGTRTPGHPGLFDAALLLEGGRVRHLVPKRLLPTYDVFHEARWFVPGTRAEPATVGGRKVGLLICEDLWDEGYPLSPGEQLEASGAELLVCASASPYRAGVRAERERHALRRRVPVVYVNAAGANDELMFDGGSFVTRDGRVSARLPRFEEHVTVVDTSSSGEVAPELPEEAETFRALVAGVRGFARKNGLRRAFLGLSGGIDSSLVACIAAEALGPGAVTALAMPSRHTESRSTDAARKLAAALGIDLVVHPIDATHAALERDLSDLVGERAPLVAENLQARLRALVLMAHVNRHGGLLLNTTNKTELALGYGTLYGDLAGTLAVIGDVSKPDVYALARGYDAGRGVIPEVVFTRPPSAELRPDQVDPFDYPRVAPVVDALVHGWPLPDGAGAKEAEGLAARIRSAEHKRWQAGIVLKVTEKSFGSGRWIPVTQVWACEAR
jgi:NAD+ synthase (glutamine-hydrolysing)